VLHVDRAASTRTRRMPASAVSAQIRANRHVATPSPRWGFACRIPPSP
jgi:hypothetical protein